MGLTGRRLLPPLLAVAVGLGGWAVAAGEGLAPDLPPAAVGDRVAVQGGGELRVEQVVPRTVGHAGPGSDPDPVPDGQHRLTLRLALVGGPDGLPRPADRLRLVVAGASHAPHRTDLEGVDVPAGSVLRGVAVFQVPKGPTRARLVLDGARQDVEVVVPDGRGQHAGH